MTGKSHLIFAAATGITMAVAGGGPWTKETVVLTSAVVGGLLPDIDSPKSKLGRIFLPVSYLANKVFGHRTFFHSLLFAGILYGLVWKFCPESLSFYLTKGLMTGVLGHFFLDMMTARGIPLFYPFIKKGFTIFRGKSGGKYEILKLALAIILVCGGILIFPFMREG